MRRAPLLALQSQRVDGINQQGECGGQRCDKRIEDWNKRNNGYATVGGIVRNLEGELASSLDDIPIRMWQENGLAGHAQALARRERNTQRRKAYWVCANFDKLGDEEVTKLCCARCEAPL